MSSKGQRRRPVRHWFGCLPVVLALLVPACSRQGGQEAEPSVAGAPSQGGSGVSAKPPGATLAVAGTLFTGEDPDQIRAYLQTVKEIRPVKFTVQWNADTVAVSKDEAMHSLLSVSRDGSTYSFNSREPVVAKLKAGSILWIYDIALKRVDRVDTRNGITLVRTSPVSVTQAFTNADIEFEAEPSLSDYFMGYRPTPSPTSSRGAQAARSSARPRSLTAITSGGRVLQPAVWRVDSGPRPTFLRVADEPPPGGHGPDTPDKNPADNPEGQGDEPIPAENAYSGKRMGFEYSVGYLPRPGGITFVLEARKENEDDGENDPLGKEQGEIYEKYAEADKEEHEAQAKLIEIKNELANDQQDLAKLDDDYAKQLAQVKGDTAAQQKLTQQYDAQKAHEQDQILATTKARDAAAKIKEDDAEKMEKLKKAAAVAGKLKELFEIVSDNVDVRFKVRADLDNFSAAGAIQVTDGTLESASAQFKNVSGRLQLAYIGRMGKPGNGVAKIPVGNLPLLFNIPFPIGGLPFVIQLGGDFNITAFLAGNHATQHFEGTYTFTGAGGFQATRSASDATSSMGGTEPEVRTYDAMSPGVSALVLGIQAPRLGIGLGAFGASSVAYIDIVHVVTMTNAAAVSTGIMLTPPCKRTTYTAYGHVGVDTKLIPLPIPFIADKVNNALTTRKEVYKRGKEVLDPPVKACEVSG